MADFDDDDDFDSMLAPPPWAVAAKTKAEPTDEKDDIFSHRNKFDAIAKDRMENEKRMAAKAKVKQEEKEQRRKEKAVKKEKKSGIKRESGGDEAEEKGDLKRRRINSEDGAKLLAIAGLSSKSAIDLSDSDDEEPVLPVRRSPRTERTRNVNSPARPQSRLKQAEQLGPELDDDVKASAIPAPPPLGQPTTDPEDEDSDPEIAAFARRVRENARLKREQAKRAQSIDPANPLADSSGGHLPAPPPDPTVEILISSPIPGTKELICRRKLSQNLQLVREAWCEKQGFDKAFADTVFLIYCGTRLWNATTVRRLGIAVNESGELYREDEPMQTGVERVHVEAVTEDIFEKIKADKSRLPTSATAEQEAEDADAGAEDPEPEAEAKSIRLIVRAKGKPDFKLKLPGDTKLERVIKAARKGFGFPSTQLVYLEFDGERLSPDEEIGNTEIEDMNCIDMFLSG